MVSSKFNVLILFDLLDGRDARRSMMCLVKLVKPSGATYNRSFAYGRCAPGFNYREYRAWEG